MNSQKKKDVSAIPSLNPNATKEVEDDKLMEVENLEIFSGSKLILLYVSEIWMSESKLVRNPNLSEIPAFGSSDFRL